MAERLRILHLEDNPNDADLVKGLLETDGLACDLAVVENRADFAAALERGDFDLILSDFSLPSYDGRSALLLARRRCPDVPYIFFSGTIGEAAAIESLKAGATDYVLKQWPARLVPAIRRALSEARESEERKRAEEKLRQVQEQFTGIFNSSKDAIGYATLDGLFLEVNAAFEKLTGHSKEELLVKTHQALTPMEYRRTEADIVNTVVRTGEPAEYEKEYIRKDGTRVPIEVTVFAVNGSDGTPAGLATIVKDITQRKIAERRRTAQYAVTSVLAESPTLAEAVPNILRPICESLGWELGALWFVDEAANVLRFVELWRAPQTSVPTFEAHTRQMVFAPGEGMPGRVWTTAQPLWIPDVIADSNFPRAPFAKQEGLHAACGFPIVSGDKVIGVLEFFSREIREPDRDLLQMLHAIVTQIGQFGERTLLAAQLRQAQKMEAIGLLAGGIAHDFNNLLTVINGYSDLTLESLAPDDRNRGSIDQIKKAGKRAAALTSQLLAFSRKQILQLKVVELSQLVRNIEPMLRRLISEDIQLTTTFAADLGTVKVDSGQIDQVLMNLVVNARDAMPKGGRISIQTANIELEEGAVRKQISVPAGSYVTLAVSDTGTGMTPEVQARIFEPFFTTKQPGKGTGLGLPMVFGIVKQSGGHVLVSSEPGRGTTFTLYFPLARDSVERDERARTQVEALGGSETLLVVEDDDSVRTFTCQVLRGQGYRVLEAKDGHHALLLCEQHKDPIHLVVTDVVMPDMSGREVADRLTPCRPETKVLYLSGYTDDTIVHHGVLDPAIAFLHKPFTPDVLLRKVREVLATPHPKS
ncbi:MAG: response regulator [Nitrospirae bacterium]|nr:MAG: response regulator [Nitrospirota bacterium]